MTRTGELRKALEQRGLVVVGRAAHGRSPAASLLSPLSRPRPRRPAGPRGRASALSARAHLCRLRLSAGSLHFSVATSVWVKRKATRVTRLGERSCWGGLI